VLTCVSNALFYTGFYCVTFSLYVPVSHKWSMYLITILFFFVNPICLSFTGLFRWANLPTEKIRRWLLSESIGSDHSILLTWCVCFPLPYYCWFCGDRRKANDDISSQSKHHNTPRMTICSWSKHFSLFLQSWHQSSPDINNDQIYTVAVYSLTRLPIRATRQSI